MLLDIVKKGSTDRSVTIRIVDSDGHTPETAVVYNTSGIDLWYRREGATKTSITEAALATPALDDPHADGGILHIGDGYYRLDLPDAAFATGANYVDVGGTVTGMIVHGGRVRLTGIDLEDTVRGGMTALPNANADAAGGLPISDAGGLDVDALNANVTAILADTAEIGAAGAGLTAIPYNSAWDADIQSDVNDALVALGLDHLVSASVAGADITDNSIIAKLVSKDGTADWDDYDNTTDSLQAISDAAAALANNPNASTFERKIGYTGVVRFLFPTDAASANLNTNSTVSVNGGSAVSLTGTITQLGIDVAGAYAYQLAYHADDRPSGTTDGQFSSFTFSDGTFTRYVVLVERDYLSATQQADLDSIEFQTETAIPALFATSGTTPVISVSATQTLITLTQGAAYSNADGTAIGFSVTGYTFTGSSVTFSIRQRSTGTVVIDKKAGVLTSTSGTIAGYVELTSAQTAVLAPNKRDYQYDFEVTTSNGNKITVVNGDLNVIADRDS